MGKESDADVREAGRLQAVRRAAARALAEAAARRAARGDEDSLAEIGGRRGPDPTRFGDWERRGVAVDF